jgi:hypothetical protein
MCGYADVKMKRNARLFIVPSGSFSRDPERTEMQSFYAARAIIAKAARVPLVCLPVMHFGTPVFVNI